MASPTIVNDPSWHIDDGATDHISADMNNLTQQDEYKGKEKVAVGNGTYLSISHIGHYIISNCSRPLHLRNILRVPNIIKSLLSASKLTRDNPLFGEFHDAYYLIKNKGSRKVLLQGRVKHGLHLLGLTC